MSILVNRAAVGMRGSCSAFSLFFFVLSVTRRRPLLGQVLVGTLNQENCNVSSESDSAGNRDF